MECSCESRRIEKKKKKRQKTVESIKRGIVHKWLMNGSERKAVEYGIYQSGTRPTLYPPQRHSPSVCSRHNRPEIVEESCNKATLKLFNLTWLCKICFILTVCSLLIIFSIISHITFTYCCSYRINCAPRNSWVVIDRVRTGKSIPVATDRIRSVDEM